MSTCECLTTSLHWCSVQVHEVYVVDWYRMSTIEKAFVELGCSCVQNHSTNNVSNELNNIPQVLLGLAGGRQKLYSKLGA